MLDTSKFDKKKNFDEMLHLVKSAPSAGVYEDPSAESVAVVDAASLPFGPEEQSRGSRPRSTAAWPSS